MTVARIHRGSELGMGDVFAAVVSRTKAAALFAQLAAISRPKQGAAKVLVLLARVADVAWLEGNIRVELLAEGDDTVIDVLADLGGLRERIFPRGRFRAPLDEFETAIARFPEALSPLVVRSSRSDRVVMTTAPTAAVNTMRPAAVEIDAASVRRATAPPQPQPIPIIAELEEARDEVLSLPSERPKAAAVSRSKPATSTRVVTKAFETSAIRREVERVRRDTSGRHGEKSIAPPAPGANPDDDVDGGWE